MRSRRVIGIASVATVLLMVLTAFAAVPGAADDKVETVIVMFNEAIDENVITDSGGSIDYEFNLIPAVVATVKASKIDGLKGHSKVKAVDLDVTVDIEKGGKKPAPKPPADVPPSGEVLWNIQNINADDVWSTTDGATIDVAILDTGIDTIFY